MVHMNNNKSPTTPVSLMRNEQSGSMGASRCLIESTSEEKSKNEKDESNKGCRNNKMGMFMASKMGYDQMKGKKKTNLSRIDI